jgi:hypothetical protein
VSEINPLYVQGVSFCYVKTIEEVLRIALLNEKVDTPRTIE